LIFYIKNNRGIKKLIIKKWVMKIMIIAQLSIVPIGRGTSISKYVRLVIETLKREGVRYEVNAMSTVIEAGTLEELFKIVQKAHQSVVDAGAERIVTELKIDDRRDKSATIESKLRAIR
jgi:uncharacterized protein (TIGR00106 family)